MGFFGDLAMGLGLKDRDASYYDRTAKTIGRNDGAAAEARYRQGRAYTEQPTRGGPVAMIGSAIDRRREGQSQGGWGYGEGDSRVSALRDMLDGGGRGRAGQRFEGGLLADLANALGIRPMGYEERLAASRPMARPTRPAAPSGPIPELQYGPRTRPTAGLSRLDVSGMNNPQEIMTERMLRRPASMGYPLGVNMPWQDASALGYSDVQTYPLSQFGNVMQRVYELGNASPSYGNIRGTGTGGGGYGFPVVGTYTF